MDNEGTDPGVHSAVLSVATEVGANGGAGNISAHAVAAELVKMGKNGHESDIKRAIRSGRFGNMIVAIVLGLGAAYGGYLLLKVTVAAHGEQIEAHKKASKETAAEIVTIDGRITAVETDIGSIKSDQRSIKSGIDELKQENVDQLKEDLEDAKRELRRERRRER